MMANIELKFFKSLQHSKERKTALTTSVSPSGRWTYWQSWWNVWSLWIVASDSVREGSPWSPSTSLDWAIWETFPTVEFHRWISIWKCDRCIRCFESIWTGRSLVKSIEHRLRRRPVEGIGFALLESIRWTDDREQDFRSNGCSSDSSERWSANVRVNYWSDRANVSVWSRRSPRILRTRNNICEKRNHGWKSKRWATRESVDGDYSNKHEERVFIETRIRRSQRWRVKERWRIVSARWRQEAKGMN